MTKESSKTIINSGHYLILGTDKFEDGEKSFPKEYFDYRRKWREWPQKKIISDFPLHLDIESTNNCNLRCLMCGRNWMKEKIGYISWELFKKIIDEAAKHHLPSIKLNYRGEPLLHPELPKLVRYAKERGVLEVQFNTNGLLLNEKRAREFIEAGLDRIIFSFDGATKKTYEKIRRGSNYETVVKNIKSFIYLRNKKRTKKPLVKIQMVKISKNKKEVEDFIRMWLPIANRVALNVEMDIMDNITKSRKSRKNVVHFPCPQIWQRLMICWDGEVRMCCGDWYGEIILGNIKESSVYDIWHGEKLNKIRELHSQGNFDRIPVCANCGVNTPKIDPELQAIVEKYSAFDYEKK